MKMRNFVIGLLAMLVLTACSGGSSASIQGQWKLVSYGPASSQTPAVADVETSLEFKDGKLNGNVGCNGFGGDYQVKGDALTFGPVMSTMMFCEAVADQESGTLTVLQEKATFVLDGNTLTITSGDGNSSIVLGKK
jgi:heat shock protein HslJ